MEKVFVAGLLVILALGFFNSSWAEETEGFRIVVLKPVPAAANSFVSEFERKISEWWNVVGKSNIPGKWVVVVIATEAPPPQGRVLLRFYGGRDAQKELDFIAGFFVNKGDDTLMRLALDKIETFFLLKSREGQGI